MTGVFGATNKNGVYLIGDEELKLSPAGLGQGKSIVDRTTEQLRINNGMKTLNQREK